MNAFQCPLLFILVIANLSHSYKTQDKVDVPKAPVPPLQVGEKTFHVQLTRATWYGAFEFCRREGMELLSIENKAETDALSNHLINNSLSSLNFWTSGENFDLSYVWFWFSTGFEVLYTNWAEGKPNKYPWNCLVLFYVEEKGYQWSDADCTYQNNFICQNNAEKF